MGSICSNAEDVLMNNCTCYSRAQSSKRDFEEKSVQTSFIFSAGDDKHSKETEKLITEIEKLKLMHQRTVITNCIKYMTKVTHTELVSFWEKWKDTIFPETFETKEEFQIFDSFEEDEENEEIKVSKLNVDEAKELIDYNNKIVLTENPLLQYSTRSNEQAMALNIVFRIFEELMDKKYEADQANFLTNRVPNSIPDFFIDHLKRVYGLKKLAQKAMSQMMISLKELYDQNHNYGRIICRLLQIYDPQPIPTPLALFITKARHDMNKIIGSKKQGKRQNTLEEIQIIEAINLVYTLFETDKFSRAKGILLLKPKIMNEEEYLLFRICNKIIRMGQTIENIFIICLFLYYFGFQVRRNISWLPKKTCTSEQ